MIYANRYLQVEAALCDHRLPVLVVALPNVPASPSTRNGWRPPGWRRAPGCRSSKGLFCPTAANWPGPRLKCRGWGRGAGRRADRCRRPLPHHRRPPRAGQYRLPHRRRLHGGKPSDMARRLLPGVTLLVYEMRPSGRGTGEGPGQLAFVQHRPQPAARRSAAPMFLPMHLSKGYLLQRARPALRRAAAAYRDHRAAPPRPRGAAAAPPLGEVPQPGENR